MTAINAIDRELLALSSGSLTETPVGENFKKCGGKP
jgi:hypothetical protein